MELARKLAPELRAGERVLLEGPMGAGKTTFARALLEALGVEQPPEGSPTFAIAHEYSRTGSRAQGTGVVHIDLYRIKSEEEIEDAGIPSYFWDETRIVICEWLSLWKDFASAVLSSGENWMLTLAIAENPERRDLKIEGPRRI